MTWRGWSNPDLALQCVGFGQARPAGLVLSCTGEGRVDVGGEEEASRGMTQLLTRAPGDPHVLTCNGDRGPCNWERLVLNMVNLRDLGEFQGGCPVAGWRD